ncbi:diguanylate cyclase domain-containing protein [Gottfriedia sp. NPDC056225]|uniref:diguanylate cyclase domain-containing protein n=1 Tax=Gottfriedia sp. NPDC056225 TaxID=3345751 RepID=UPI0035DAE24D
MTCNKKGIVNAKKLGRQKKISFEYHYENYTIHVTMTFGLSMFDPQKGVSESISRADQAMYVGKQTGKNCVICYDELKAENPLID